METLDELENFPRTEADREYLRKKALEEMADPSFKQIKQRSQSSDNWKIAENALAGTFWLGFASYFLANNSNPYISVDSVQFNILNTAVGSTIGFIAGALLGLYQNNKTKRKEKIERQDISYQCSRL